MTIKQNSWMAILAIAMLGLSSNGWAQQENKDEKKEVEPKPVAVGDKVPDFDLESMDGKRVKLSERFGENGKPVILLFSRANW